MSVVLKTIEAFPRGRSTRELMVLTGHAFDSVKREQVCRELLELQAGGTIILGRDNKWRAARYQRAPATPADREQK